MHFKKPIIKYFLLFFAILVSLVSFPVPVKALSCIFTGQFEGYIYIEDNKIKENFYISYQSTGNLCDSISTVKTMDQEEIIGLENNVLKLGYLNGTYKLENHEYMCIRALTNPVECSKSMKVIKVSESIDEFKNELKQAQNNEIIEQNKASSTELEGRFQMGLIVLGLILIPFTLLLLVRKKSIIYSIGIFLLSFLAKFIFIYFYQFTLLWTFSSWKNLYENGLKVLLFSLLIELITIIILKRFQKK